MLSNVSLISTWLFNHQCGLLLILNMFKTKLKFGFYSLPRKSSLSSFKTSKAVLVAGEE